MFGECTQINRYANNYNSWLDTNNREAAVQPTTSARLKKVSNIIENCTLAIKNTVTKQ